MPRILFVDDELRVLDGLRQSLRGKRKVWDMVFVASGAEALAHMEHASFDIVVSDMRMPVMDGAELLYRAAFVQPHAARIVLSGQMDEVTVTRAATVAHRFLVKPCPHDVLEATLERTLELSSLLGSERIRGCVSGMMRLPSLPKACLELNEALKGDKAPLHRVVQIVESDVGMASKVLQLVNSSLFGLNCRVSSIPKAVNYLGLNTLHHLVFAESMFEEFRGADLESFEREQSRSILCARIARELIADKKSAEAAATAALLHDIGSLVLSARLPDAYRMTRQFAVSRNVPLVVAEREQLGATHAEIGAYLLSLWGLPHDIIEAVAAHHAPFMSEDILDVGTAVRLADPMAASLLGDEEAHGDCPMPPPEVLERLGVKDLYAKLRDKLRASLTTHAVANG